MEYTFLRGGEYKVGVYANEVSQTSDWLFWGDKQIGGVKMYAQDNHFVMTSCASQQVEYSFTATLSDRPS